MIRCPDCEERLSLLNHKIADQALYDKGLAELTQATVDILNSLHQDGVQTQQVGS